MDTHEASVQAVMRLLLLLLMMMMRDVH